MTNERTVIVTGATGGIGRAIVEELSARPQIRVIVAVRNTERARQMFPTLEAIEMDLASLKSVENAAQTLIDSGIRIDGLINNAGIMPGDITITDDGYELATQVNYVATKLLTDMLLPIINDGASIVFTTSVTRCLGKDHKDWAEYARRCRGLGRRFRVYGQSKRMIAAYASRLSAELHQRGIRVNCADPGIVDTNMITMGNRVIDALANAMFRPLISTPTEGAIPAIRAFDSPLTGLIFTKKHQTRNNYDTH